MNRGYDRGRGRAGSPAGRGSPDTRGGGTAFRGHGGPPRGGGGGRGGFRGGIFAPGPANIDARLLDNSDKALVSSFRNISQQSDDLPLRPGFGTIGKNIKLRANFFPVKVPKGPLFEYNVSISPTTTIRRVKRRIFQLAEQTADWTRSGLKGNVAHDHSQKLITAKRLPQPLTIRVPFYDEDEDGPKAGGKEYTLTIEFGGNLDMQNLHDYLEGSEQHRGYDVLPIISALNLILAAHPNRSGGDGIMVGRNRYFFAGAEPPVPLGGGLEAWKGFYSSVRPTHNQLMVNVNVCTTAFYTPGSLARAMIEFRQASFGARVNAFVKGIRVKTTHLGYKKTVKALSTVNARQHIFEVAEFGGNISVEVYFKRKYKITLQQPELLLVDVGGQKSNLLPPELCQILPNQPYRGKLTEEHTAAMITTAARPPNINAQSITNQGLDLLGFKRGATPLGAFGVSIGSEMAVVPGRILPPPGIKYNSGTPAVDEKASWNLRNVRFAKGARLSDWAVLLIKDGNSRDEFSGHNDQELLNTVRGFADMCRKSGMEVDRKDPVITMAILPQKDYSDPTRRTAITQIEKTLKSIKKPTMVLVFLSNGDKHIYSGLKHLCDSYLDLATVCVHSSKIRKEKGQMQYFANVALKVNMKLGGANHYLDDNVMKSLRQDLTMLVGIDVTHPGPGSVRGTPSIAAVVASVDGNYAQFPVSMEIQESKKEMVTNLEKMMVERLDLFRSRSNKLPGRILVYRDGVSEGQFLTVVGEELPAIKAAFKKFNTAKDRYQPKLTIVICGKRHHTRFYPPEAENADSNGNPKAGTVVDRGVTAIYNFDFFLQAHGGLQGTTRPTHYYVVHDEYNFGADNLQGLTNAVSYMFARATKAVSLVSPAYYADLACERGRCYLHKLLQGHGSTGSSSSAEQETMREATVLWHRGVSGKLLKDTMYYL